MDSFKLTMRQNLWSARALPHTLQEFMTLLQTPCWLGRGGDTSPFPPFLEPSASNTQHLVLQTLVCYCLSVIFIVFTSDIMNEIIWWDLGHNPGPGLVSVQSLLYLLELNHQPPRHVSRLMSGLTECSKLGTILESA